MVSPRARASTPQQTAPTTATAPQISVDLIVRAPPAGPADELPPVSSVVIVPDMSAPSHSCQRPVDAGHSEHRENAEVRRPGCANRYPWPCPGVDPRTTGGADVRPVTFWA